MWRKGLWGVSSTRQRTPGRTGLGASGHSLVEGLGRDTLLSQDCVVGVGWEVTVSLERGPMAPVRPAGPLRSLRIQRGSCDRY